jgi:V8-like Glu-specific endopeptidase
MSTNAADRSGEGDPDATLEYWTEERLSRARPVEPPRAEPVPGEIDTSAPPAQTDASEGPGSPEGAAPRAELPEAFATALVAHPAQYPHRTVGKLFVRIGGEDRAGSAAVVNRSGILTAAHCVRDPYTGAWATQVAFAPAFDNGVNPAFGLWPVGMMFVRNEWLVPPIDTSFDFSFCRVPSVEGVEIGDLVGWLGIVVNRPDIRYWNDHGYPAAAIAHFPFNGQRMWNCAGDYSQLVGSTVFKDGNLTGGASGGPWIVQNDQGLFFANGTYSMFFGNPPTQNTSPYFRDVVMALFRDAFGG